MNAGYLGYLTYSDSIRPALYGVWSEVLSRVLPSDLEQGKPLGKLWSSLEHLVGERAPRTKSERSPALLEKYAEDERWEKEAWR